MRPPPTTLTPPMIAARDLRGDVEGDVTSPVAPRMVVGGPSARTEAGRGGGLAITWSPSMRAHFWAEAQPASPANGASAQASSAMLW